MKSKYLTICAIALALVAAVLIPKIIKNHRNSKLPLQEQALIVFSEGNCLRCHSQAPVHPWYHSVPGLADKVEKAAKEGVRAIDLESSLAQLNTPKGMSLPDVIRIENAVKHMQTRAVLTNREVDKIKEWMRDYRQSRYPNSNADHFKNEAIHVIPDVSPLPVDTAKAKLGEALFLDTRFSADNSLSCASCHLPEEHFVDHEQVSDGVAGAVGTVNAPTVLNSVFNFVQFWDGRAVTLAEQAAGPPVNPVEMACKSFDEIVEKFVRDKEFMKAFGKVYSEVTEATLTDAIEHYERSLITPGGPFDSYLKGNALAISPEAIEGYALFKDNNCAGCHSGPNAGGLSFEYMGLKHDYFADRGECAEVVDDNGHFNVTGNPYDLHRFKVPGLRNVAYTQPYFHDGNVVSLEQAVKDMAWYQYGVKLSGEECAKICAFLETL